MQLVSLTANNLSFKPVHFKNEAGLNFIIATQKDPESTEKGKSSTFNGVGKSLIVALIHFCLGSSKKDGLKKSLSGWTFTLEFKIGEKEFKAQRSTDKQDKIFLNGEEISILKFNKKLGDLLFDIPNETSQLSFRSLIPFFIRPRKASYTSFNNPNAIKNDYQIQITNALLLGLDVLLVEEKFRLRKEKERIKNLVKELNQDELLRDFFNHKKDASLEAQQVREDIERLQNDLTKFQVAEDYYEVNAQADKLKNELDRISNKIILLQNQIKSIDETRKVSSDIKKENIENIYNEAAVILKEDTLKTLNELEKFYEYLSSSREKRLLEQKNNLQRQLKDLEIASKEKGEELDNKLKYLNATQALDVFVKLNNKLSDLKSKEINITKYDKLIGNYNKSKIQTEKKFLESTESTNSYLDDAKEVISVVTDFFRSLAKRFYPNSTSGISIINNDGDNQIRYTIDAKIEADASDGINSIKICYDMTLLLKGYAHRVNFLFHDSRLLSDTDPRQVAELFKILL